MTKSIAIAVGLATWFVPHRETVGGYPVCASRTIPKGSLVRVTDTHNGLSVFCIVDDWGPAKWTKASIDLAPKAFECLNGKEMGKCEVKIEILKTKHYDNTTTTPTRRAKD